MDLKTADKTENSPEQKGIAKPTWYFCAFQALVVVVCVVLGLEFLFSLGHIGEAEYLKPDPVLGFSPMPNKHVTKADEGLGQAQYNKYALPEPERSLNKPANTYRIVVIGDSFVEALQVERKENFCYLLEEALNKNYPTTHFEVMNFGVAGYNLGQMYLRLKQSGFQFQPDMVLLPVRCDTTFVLQPTPAIGLTTARPYFFAAGDKLLTDYTVYNTWLKTSSGKRTQLTGWLREHSRIWGVVSLAAQQLIIWYQGIGTNGWGATVTNKKTAFAESSSSCTAPPPKATGPKTFMIGNTEVSSDDYYSARDKGIRYFWPIADGIITAIKKECDQNKCKLVIVQLPGAGGSSNPLETEMLGKTAARLGVPFEDNTAGLAKEPASKLYYQIHFTPAGHKLYTEQITPFVLQNVRDDLEKRKGLDPT